MSAAQASQPSLKSKTVFVESPGPSVNVTANAFYTRSRGPDMLCVMGTSTRSDTTDTAQRRFSSDNGRTWSDWEPVSFITETEAGVHREYAHPGWADPTTDRLLCMVNEALLPTDNPLEGLRHWVLRYRVSVDGGRTNAVDRQVIQKGDHTPEHPLEGVWVGKNCLMIGASTCRPIRTRQGRILVPVQITPVGPDGEYYNPGGGYTYHEAAVLIGAWTGELTIEWDLSQTIANDPDRSTRGCVEPTIAQMRDERILMVMRGSNDVRPELPGHKWYSVSEDDGLSWSAPDPWTYADGASFFSPSSCSQLLRHSSGRVYWLGNISPENPRGNSPRYPLVIGEVDPKTFLLLRHTVSEIDTRGPDEDASLQLSNFLAYEDWENADIVVHCSRFFPEGPHGWWGKAYVYRIEVPR